MEEKVCQRVRDFLFSIRVVREGLAEKMTMRKKPRGSVGTGPGVSEERCSKQKEKPMQV